MGEFRSTGNLLEPSLSFIFEPQCEKTSDMCAQRRLKSDCASAQSDQSLRCAHEETLHPCLSKMHTVKLLVRLCERDSWTESSLGAHVRMYVAWRCGTFGFIMFMHVCHHQYTWMVTKRTSWLVKASYHELLRRQSQLQLTTFRYFVFFFRENKACLFVLRFYGPVNPVGSCRARSVYLTTRLLGRLSPLSG